jgi:superoxide dismutase
MIRDARFLAVVVEPQNHPGARFVGVRNPNSESYFPKLTTQYFARGRHLGMLLKIFTFGALSPLILDVFEHAFMIDYGLKRVDYIAAFFKNIKWEAAEGRMK